MDLETIVLMEIHQTHWFEQRLVSLIRETQTIKDLKCKIKDKGEETGGRLFKDGKGI